MKKRKLLTAVSLIFLGILFAGCATSPSRIAGDPQHWDGKSVTVRGTAGWGFQIPLTEVSVFLLENPDGNVPVVTTAARKEGGRTAVRGEVWAFPERGMTESSTAAVEALEVFLVDHRFVKREQARQMSAVILTVVREMARGLGHVWFIIEK